MRRLLLMLLAVALGAWLVSSAMAPFVPRAVEFEQSIGRDAGKPAAGGWRSAVIRAPRRFDLVGLSWRAPRHAGARIRVRDATSGAWSPWTALADDHGGGAGTEPVWAGGADAYQLSLRRVPRGLRAQFVNSTGTATAAQRALSAVRRTAHAVATALADAPARAQGGAPPIVPRAAWGADQCKPRTAPDYGTVQTGFVHHTVNANAYGPQDSAAIVLAICRYHRDSKGWRDIGYNFLVDRYGQVFEGRAGGVDQAVIGAQAQGYNGVSTGIANIGTFSAVAQTADAVHATAQLLAWKLSLHGVPVQGQVSVLSRGGPSARAPAGTPVTLPRIAGHRDGDRTTCPGDGLYAQLAEIRRLAAEAAPGYLPPAPAATVTIEAADAALQYPQAAQLAGRVLGPGGAPLPGIAVSIQFASAAGFLPRAGSVTGADGSWSAQVPTQYTRTLRAVARLPGGAMAASAPLAVRVAPRIGALAPKRVVAQRTFTVRGSIRPLRARAVLVIARSGSDGRLHTVARLAMKGAGGSVATTVRLRRPALHRLRIESRADARNLAGRSRDVYLRAVRPRR